jgi:hypothetical protein
MACGHVHVGNFRSVVRNMQPANSGRNGAEQQFFGGQYSTADAPKVLFQRIENCAKIAIMGINPCTNCKLINNAINLFLTTGLYQRPFKEWDRLTNVQQTWIALRTLIQEVFQHCVNTTAPTAGHHRYALAQPFQQNAFGALTKDNNNNELITTTVAKMLHP